MDHFNNLHPLVKFTIAIPIIVFILAVFIQTSRKDRLVSNTQSLIIPNQKPLQTDLSKGPESLVDSFVGDGKSSIDLEGPSVCTYSDTNIQAEAQIKNKQIFAQVKQNGKQNNYLMKDDCLYYWLDNQTSGLKVCELGQYVSMIGMFSSFVSPDMILSMVSGLNPSMPVPQDAVLKVFSSCKKMEVDQALFEVPSSILFKKSSLTELQSQVK